MDLSTKEALERAVIEANAAHERQDWQGAIDAWKSVVELDPSHINGYWLGGTLLLASGKLEEAEAMLSKGAALDPRHIQLGINHAMAATLLKNWPEAHRRWNALSRRAPNDEDVAAGRAQAEMHLRLHRMDEEAESGAADTEWRRFETGRVSNKDADLFNRFQSVGDNCEFGLVQRHFRAEPVSLLRWAGISVDALINGLDKRFVGLGDPKHTELSVVYDEYVLDDRLYSTGMHTFLKPQMTKETPEELHAKMCKRQAFLGRKFIEDLEEPEHIFVFKSINESSTDKARELHAAMQRYGPVNLLFAVEAGERPAGSVEEIQPRLFIGAIDRFSHPGEGWDNLHWDTWRSVCREVLQRVEASEPARGFLERIFQKAQRRDRA